MAKVRKNYREESRKNYGNDFEEREGVSVEQLNAGSLMRIADATEMMAKDRVRMENDLEYYKRRLKEKEVDVKHLARSNAALRGHIGRLKRGG